MDAARIREAAREVRTTPLAKRALKARIQTGDVVGADFASRERMRSIFTLERLAELCTGMSVRSGRTALVWISSGLFLANLDVSGRAIDADMFIPDQQIAARLEELQEAANSANVSVYPRPLGSL